MVETNHTQASMCCEDLLCPTQGTPFREFYKTAKTHGAVRKYKNSVEDALRVTQDRDGRREQLTSTHTAIPARRSQDGEGNWKGKPSHQGSRKVVYQFSTPALDLTSTGQVHEYFILLPEVRTC